MRSRDAMVDTGDLRSEKTGSDPGDMRRRGRRESPPEDLGQGDPCDKRSQPQDIPKPQARAGGSNLPKEVRASGGLQHSSRRWRQYGVLAENKHTRRNWRRDVRRRGYRSSTSSAIHGISSIPGSPMDRVGDSGSGWDPRWDPFVSWAHIWPDTPSLRELVASTAPPGSQDPRTKPSLLPESRRWSRMSDAYPRV